MCLIGVRQWPSRTGVRQPRTTTQTYICFKCKYINVSSVFPFSLNDFLNFSDRVVILNCSLNILIICEWRIFSVILYHCCATLPEKILWDVGWSKKWINKMFPNKPKKDVEYFFLSCTIKMHAVLIQYYLELWFNLCKVQSVQRTHACRFLPLQDECLVYNQPCSFCYLHQTVHQHLWVKYDHVIWIIFLNLYHWIVFNCFSISLAHWCSLRQWFSNFFKSDPIFFFLNCCDIYIYIYI